MDNLLIEDTAPFSDKEIENIQNIIGRNLPDDYAAFAKKYGGCFIGGEVDGNADLPILGFLNANADDGVLSVLDTHPDMKADKILPFADCSLGNLWVFSDKDEIFYVNYYDGFTKSTKVSNSFSDLIKRIVRSDN
ncbi:MAG: SMI1/KNR4 family protein [Sphingomonadaceae bacterium]|jgi:hypothetical protein